MNILNSKNEGVIRSDVQSSGTDLSRKKVVTFPDNSRSVSIDRGVDGNGET